ncbi:MAG: DUF6524 family protein [Pseudomonadota bacterium]
MTGFLIRWAFAFLLTASTYNPTQYNYVRWALETYETGMSFVVLAGLVLFIGYIIYLRATLRSIGVFGVILVLALIGALVWVLMDLGWLSLENANLNLWIGNVALSFVLGVGMSWSIIRRAISGQADVDDVDE